MVQAQGSAPTSAPAPARKLRVGVLASGNGTNLQALAEACAAPGFPAEIALLGCNRGTARVLERARAAGVAVCLADRAAIKSRAARQAMLRQALQDAGVELVVLAGFDEICAPELVDAFEGRMINTHPSLLPAFGGTMHAVQQALDHGAKVSGCTVHLVTNDLDAGPILLQRCVEVYDDDTEATLHARILREEHQLLPAAVRAFAEGRVRVEGSRARVLGSPRPPAHSGS